jgi:DNA-directed RNA polymerase subunit RPC12/RpoP
MPDLAYVECTECKNYFFIHDIMDLNNPIYCPYCGIEFKYEMEI